MTLSRHILGRLALLLALLPATQPAQALDLFGVQNAALDQPRAYGLLELGGGADPVGITAFLDTGGSGVVISEQTADDVGLVRYANPLPPPQYVLFEDVGIAGAAPFNVSQPLHVGIAPFTPFVDPTDPSVYTQRFGPLRTQIGPLGVPPSIFGGTDVFGMPTMAGKVVVMDPKPLNAFVTDPTTGGLMQTYLYDPGTPYRPATAESDPGIPPTNRTIELTYASGDRFTRLTPPSAEPPALAPNPFVGPNPLAKIDPTVPAGTTPGVTISLNGRETTGSFLLDTGAAASVISLEQAANLHVRYRPGAATPTLELFDPADPNAPGQLLPDQFVLTLTGVGGDETAAGFFLDWLLVRTKEGNAAIATDPAHLRYVRAPVLVLDISLLEVATGKVLTLDGLFAMNLLVATAFVSEAPFTFDSLTLGLFNWVVFDQPNGLLLLDVAAIPEPGTWAMMFAGLALLACVARRRIARA